MTNTPHFAQQTDKISKGQITTQKFVIFMKSKGWTVEQATLKEDMSQHIDYFISKGERRVGVDVKSRSKYGWISELNNVFGQKGSLFGQQEYLCYLSDSTIYFVKPTKIIEYINNNFDLNSEVFESHEISKNLPEWKYGKIFGRRHGFGVTQGYNDKDKWVIIPDIVMEKICHCKFELKK